MKYILFSIFYSEYSIKNSTTIPIKKAKNKTTAFKTKVYFHPKNHTIIGNNGILIALAYIKAAICQHVKPFCLNCLSRNKSVKNLKFHW